MKTVDFGELWDTLRSDDQSLLESLAWVFEDQNDSKYFNMKDPPSGRTVESTGNMVSYSSFPRCGNTFLRKNLQNITGISTGSDMSVEFNLDMQLKFFKAEEITDSSVWVKKSHDPKYDDMHKVHKCHKIICVVRNPYDITSSLMHFFPVLNQGG